MAVRRVYGSGMVIETILLLIVMLAALCLIPIGLPGTFIMCLAYLVFVLATGGGAIAWWTFAAIFFLALLAEGIEMLAGLVGARRAKGSWWSAFGALLGGFAGALIGIWFALLGAIPGAIIGTFVGAYLVEYMKTHNSETSGKVAFNAMVGRIVGGVVKIGIGLLMIVLVMLMLIVQSQQ